MPFANQYLAGAGHHDPAFYGQQPHHQQQQALYRNQHSSSVMSHGAGQDMGNGIMSEENSRVVHWIAELLKEETREQALLELSKKREQVPELAQILWHSFGEMTCIPYI